MAKNTTAHQSATATLRAEATRSLYVTAGVADLAVEAVKGAVADVHQRITGVQKDVEEARTEARSALKPAALRDRAVSVVNHRVETVTEEAKARRAAVEARVAELQKIPGKVQTAVDENVAAATTTYTDLAKRGENAVKKLRGLPEVKETVAEAKTTTAKAKTTRTQATKAATSTRTQVERDVKAEVKAVKTAATRTRKAATKRATPARSSAKATVTAAKKTAENAVEATKAAADAAGTSSAS